MTYKFFFLGAIFGTLVGYVLVWLAITFDGVQTRPWRAPAPATSLNEFSLEFTVQGEIGKETLVVALWRRFSDKKPEVQLIYMISRAEIEGTL